MRMRLHVVRCYQEHSALRAKGRLLTAIPTYRAFVNCKIHSLARTFHVGKRPANALRESLRRADHEISTGLQNTDQFGRRGFMGENDWCLGQGSKVKSVKAYPKLFGEGRYRVQYRRTRNKKMTNKAYTTYQEWTSYSARKFFHRTLNFNLPPTFKLCPMCYSTITPRKISTTVAAKRYIKSARISPIIDSTEMYLCQICDWWSIRERGFYIYTNNGWEYLATGIQKQWDLSSSEIPLEIVHDYIDSQNPLFDFKILNPYTFEKLIAEVLRVEYHPCEVHYVGAHGGGGDGGIDLYLVKDNIEWLIQVKRRLNSKSEAVETIRLLNGVLLREGKQNGMVVTSAKKFSRNAKNEVQIKTPGTYVVRLIDRGDIHSFLARMPSGRKPGWMRAQSDTTIFHFDDTLPDIPEELGLILLGRPKNSGDTIKGQMKRSYK